MVLLAATGLLVALVDPLVKVFPASIPRTASYVAEAARGEVASWQVAVRSDQDAGGLTIDAGVLRGPGGASLGRPRIRAIGYVPVTSSIPTPPKIRIAPVPGLFPDPLLADLPDRLKADETRSYWIDVAIPKNAVAGDYSTIVHVRSASPPSDETVTLNAKVYPVAVGKSRLWVTNWYSPPPGDPQAKDSPFWRSLALYAKNMASHRQNVAMVSPLSTVKIREDGSFDFDTFDRWVQVFRKAGVIGRIEGGHFGGRVGDWRGPFQMTILERKEGQTLSRSVSPTSPEADAFYAKFLPAFVQNLKSHRWLSLYRQHLADEPIDENAESYLQMRDLVRKYGPQLKTMEANYTKKVVGAIDLWVPLLDTFDKSLAFYRERQAKGEEVWFYTCVVPQGEYPNRFMEQPLVETRLLQWLNFKYGATGYLHWGWNHWSMMRKSPFEETVYDRPNEGLLPAGDCFIVYPGKDGDILDSIRWETMRDGIADYELLSMLASKDKPAARALADRLIRSFTSYVTDPSAFRSVRHDLLNELSGYGS